MTKPVKPRKPKPIEVAGEKYYTLGDFAALVEKHKSYISMLFNDGGKERKLRGIRIGNKPLILAKELEEYPFPGRA